MAERSQLCNHQAFYSLCGSQDGKDLLRQVFLQLSWYFGCREQEGRETGRNLPPQPKKGGHPPGPNSRDQPELASSSRRLEPQCRSRAGAAGRASGCAAHRGGELLTPRASCGCKAGAAASPASLALPRLPGSIRITSWSKYAGQPENQSRHNQRLVNCTVAETHPSHPLLSPLPPQPSAFRTIKDSIIGERKI